MVAPRIRTPPSSAQGLGRSPWKSQDQTGFSTGSISRISDASSAGITLRPRVTKVYATAIWNTPR
jgi:hypothetical protein